MSKSENPRREKLEGKRFGKLVVIEDLGNKNNRAIYECICDCGNKRTVYAYSLKSGYTKQCHACGFLRMTNSRRKELKNGH